MTACDFQPLLLRDCLCFPGHYGTSGGYAPLSEDGTEGAQQPYFSQFSQAQGGTRALLLATRYSLLATRYLLADSSGVIDRCRHVRG